MVQTLLGGTSEAKDMLKLSYEDEETNTKEHVDDIKGTNWVDQADDNTNSDSAEDMPTVETLIHKIVKEGKKLIREEVESEEEGDD